MNTALALILVINAHLVSSQSGPDLPDDFGRSGDTVVVQSQPSISFSAIASGPSQLVRSTGTQIVVERWLVSEPWCVNCPAAKKRFLAAGNTESHVITSAEAKRRHGKSISTVPAEYTIEETVRVEYLQPPTYRKEWPPKWDVEGDKLLSKGKLLKHLRDGSQHRGKHWQAWHLESWPVEQLAALHSDDHLNAVPRFDETEHGIEAIVENASLSVDSIAAALSAHLLTEQQAEPIPETYAGLFDIEIDTPDSARKWASDLLSKQSVEFPSAGVSASWKGGDRTLSVTPGSLRITPGVTVSVRKYGVSVSTTLTACSFDPALSWVKLELTNAPDLTVRFK